MLGEGVLEVVPGARGSSLRDPGVRVVGGVLGVGVHGYKGGLGVYPAGLVRRDVHAPLRLGDDARGARVGREGQLAARLDSLPLARGVQRGALHGVTDLNDPVHAVGVGGGRDLPTAHPRGPLVFPDPGRGALDLEGGRPRSRLLWRRGGERGQPLRGRLGEPLGSRLRGDLGARVAFGTVYFKKYGERLSTLWAVAMPFSIGGVLLTGLGLVLEPFSAISWNGPFVASCCTRRL